MNVSVCIKRVPDTEAHIRIDQTGTDIDNAGIKYIISPYDEFAIEAGLRVKEKMEGGEVSLLTVGTNEAQETLRNGLAMGADKATLLRADSYMDGLGTAKALAVELRDSDAQLILFGVKAAGSDQQQVGPMVATLLDIPCVTEISSFEFGEGVVTCQRQIEGGIEVVEVDLPAVLTITKGEYEPRYASLKGIMAAKRKPLEEREADFSQPGIHIERLNEPTTRGSGCILEDGPDAAAELVRLLREEANAL
ncbi:MAG: electron transfer flavoprotein subunit beta/FixA family protein [Gemmatimonadota bacterium]|nr:electron transfer flavoprotein subunit beta/FixA family protein [Gemmatimonadota bacterium]